MIEPINLKGLIMFQVAIRGIPNFAHLQFEMFETFDDLHSKYRVRIQHAAFEPRAEVFNGDGKRVILYILPSEHATETLQNVCRNYRLLMEPSGSDRSRLGVSGIGTARSGQWQAVDPSSFPDYSDRLNEYHAECRRIAVEQKAAEERDEIEAAELASVLDRAIEAKGRDAVLSELRSLGQPSRGTKPAALQ